MHHLHQSLEVIFLPKKWGRTKNGGVQLVEVGESPLVSVRPINLRTPKNVA